MSLSGLNIPANASFEQTAKILNNLLRNTPSTVKEIKKVGELANGLTDVTKRVKEVKEIASKGEQLAKEAKNKLKELANLTKEFNKVKSKIPRLEGVANNLKAGNFNKVMPGKSASGLVLIAGIAAAALGVALIGKQNEIWEYDAKTQAVREAGINADFQFVLKTRAKLNTLETNFNKLKADLDATKKTVYGDIQNLLNNFPKIRETANNALYEVRQGRKILEGQISTTKKIANDALYEVRQGRVKLDGQINTLKSDVLGLIGKITGIQINANKVPGLEAKINSIKPNLSDADRAKINQASSDASKALTGLNTVPNQITAKVNEQISLIQNGLNAQLNLKLDKTGLLPAITANAGIIAGILKPSITALINPLITAAIAPFQLLTQGLKLSIDLIGNKTIQQDARLGDIERVNAEGNQRLTQIGAGIAGLTSLINSVPQGTIDKFNQQVSPKIPDMAAAGTCKTLQPGGCMRNSLDNLGNGINNNTNNSNNSLFNRFNTALNAANAGANAAQLAILNTVNSKLGQQINGGLSGAIKNTFNNAIVDRAINYVTLVTTMHNALMLSNNLSQTLFSTIDTILQATGIEMKDADGSVINTGQVINGFFLNFFNSIFGADNVTGIRAVWAQYSRIYQAGATIMQTMQSLFDASKNIAELTVGNIGKIGNALKKAGAVAENAYAFMAEKVTSNTARQKKFEDFAAGIGQASEVASNIENIASSVVSVQSELNEFKQQKEAFSSAVTGEVSTTTANEATQKPNITIDFTNIDVTRNET